jgi:hypothetical protein
VFGLSEGWNTYHLPWLGSGGFGAQLMNDPDRVAHICEGMLEATKGQVLCCGVGDDVGKRIQQGSIVA